jgi:hypothetical protein
MTAVHARMCAWKPRQFCRMVDVIDAYCPITAPMCYDIHGQDMAIALGQVRARWGKLEWACHYTVMIGWRHRLKASFLTL